MFGEGLCKIQRRALLAPLSLQGQVEEVVTRTQKRTMCQNLSKLRAPKIFDLASLLQGIYSTDSSCIENRDIWDRTVYYGIIWASRV